jgi:hypothetical protein
LLKPMEYSDHLDKCKILIGPGAVAFIWYLWLWGNDIVLTWKNVSPLQFTSVCIDSILGLLFGDINTKSRFYVGVLIIGEGV